jgi:hypothetical protein
MCECSCFDGYDYGREYEGGPSIIPSAAAASGAAAKTEDRFLFGMKIVGFDGQYAPSSPPSFPCDPLLSWLCGVVCGSGIGSKTLLRFRPMRLCSVQLPPNSTLNSSLPLQILRLCPPLLQRAPLQNKASRSVSGRARVPVDQRMHGAPNYWLHALRTQTRGRRS